MSNDDCDELCSVDIVSFDLEKENEDCSNLKEADVPSGKKRKCKKDKPCKETTKPRKTARKGVYLQMLYVMVLVQNPQSV